MHPDFIHVRAMSGVIDIGAYSFFLWSAMIVMGIGLYRVMNKLQKYSKSQAVGISIGIMMLALIGARLMHVVTNLTAYAKDPSQIYSLDLHGLSIFGGMILVGIFIFFVGYVKRVMLWKNADALMPYVGTSIVLARIGCFLGGCCFGVVTRMPWGVRFPLFSDAHMYQLAHGQTNLLVSLPVHPTQLYEAIGTCISTIVAMRLTQTRRFTSGDTLVTCIGMYFFTRLVTHFFRAYPDSFSTASLFPFFYLGIVLYCMIYMFWQGRGLLRFDKRRKDR